MVTKWSTRPYAPPEGPPTYSRTTHNALSTAAERILLADGSRVSALIRNLATSAAEIVYLGDDATVVSTTGTPLTAGTVHGESREITHQGEVWAISGSGTPTISIEEKLQR